MESARRRRRVPHLEIYIDQIKQLVGISVWCRYVKRLASVGHEWPKVEWSCRLVFIIFAMFRWSDWDNNKNLSVTIYYYWHNVICPSQYVFVILKRIIDIEIYLYSFIYTENNELSSILAFIEFRGLTLIFFSLKYIYHRIIYFSIISFRAFIICISFCYSHCFILWLFRAFSPAFC